MINEIGTDLRFLTISSNESRLDKNLGLISRCGCSWRSDSTSAARIAMIVYYKEAMDLSLRAPSDESLQKGSELVPGSSRRLLGDQGGDKDTGFKLSVLSPSGGSARSYPRANLHSTAR